MCVQGRVHVCPCTWKPVVNDKRHPQSLDALLLELRVSRWTYCISFQEGGLALRLQGATCLHLPRTEMTGTHCQAWIFTWLLGIRTLVPKFLKETRYQLNPLPALALRKAVSRVCIYPKPLEPSFLTLARPWITFFSSTLLSSFIRKLWDTLLCQNYSENWLSWRMLIINFLRPDDTRHGMSANHQEVMKDKSEITVAYQGLPKSMPSVLWDSSKVANRWEGTIRKRKPMWWLIVLVSVARFGITQEMHPWEWMSMRLLPERIDGGWKMHPEYRWIHPMDWGSMLNKKRNRRQRTKREHSSPSPLPDEHRCKISCCRDNTKPFLL